MDSFDVSCMLGCVRDSVVRAKAEGYPKLVEKKKRTKVIQGYLGKIIVEITDDKDPIDSSASS